jgi:phosphate transport system protein
MDLRFIIAVLKMTNDLERIADLAVNIAEQGEFLAAHTPIDVPFDFDRLANHTQDMLRKSLDAMINLDADTARAVCRADETADAINHEMFAQISECILQHTDWLEQLLRFRSISRYLERIADHATNIAEDAVYMVEGNIIRHGMPDGPEGDDGA